MRRSPRCVIDQIDEAGYLPAPLRETSQRLGIALAQLEAVLGVVQTLDPTGVGARTLAECIALQAQGGRSLRSRHGAVDRQSRSARARTNLPQLKRMCGVDDEDFADMLRELRGYDPKPGLRFGGTRTEAVTPDLFVRATHRGLGD